MDILPGLSSRCSEESRRERSRTGDLNLSRDPLGDTMTLSVSLKFMVIVVNPRIDHCKLNLSNSSFLRLGMLK